MRDIKIFVIFSVAALNLAVVPLRVKLDMSRCSSHDSKSIRVVFCVSTRLFVNLKPLSVQKYSILNETLSNIYSKKRKICKSCYPESSSIAVYW